MGWFGWILLGYFMGSFTTLVLISCCVVSGEADKRMGLK